MNKKIYYIVLILIIIISSGCTNKINQNDNKKRIYLSDKYYNKGEFINIKNEDIDSLKNDTYILFTYNNYCTLPISCEEIFKKFMDIYKIDILSITFSDFKESIFYEKIKYAPSVIIIKNNEIIDYLDAESDDDLNKYQDLEAFSNWLDEYIYFAKK